MRQAFNVLRGRRFAGLLVMLCLSAASLAAPLPETGANPHEGVASCATSVCHGKVSEDESAPVWLNEYRIWLRNDYHSRAYRTLQTEQSEAIARKLGLPSAAGAKICLDCHADNVATEARGRRFQISDGVGCEACHGGAGQWLESHAEAGTSHADNLAKGMYPTEQPLERARLCLSCHLGTKDKFATHQIMGAGHPRLAFELETFTVNQPAHYEVDADYRERKPAIASVNMWLAGLAVTGQQTLELLQEDWFTQQSLMPELSFYQCHACHHPMNDLRWSPEGTPPGTVRLNDASLLVLAEVLDVLGSGDAATLRSGIQQLHQASLNSRGAVVTQAKSLAARLDPIARQVSAGSYGADDMRRLRAGLLQRAAAGRFRHFTAAEQVFLAVETLAISIGDADQLESLLDAWFKSVEDENTFVPQQFAVRANQVLGGL
ncbi:multiheme c-type cytochrome [Parahaliea mediterranea]|uniref:multiheme c-type cytochrome n=1 Tax=Parahaliea mediterranea TaxID=651086 RepID=UPI000E2EEA9D|nr:multiheme c-type cytochrome [Parahaliea mediterranea]